MMTYRDRVDQITRLSDWSRAVIDGLEALAEDADTQITFEHGQARMMAQAADTEKAEAKHWRERAEHAEALLAKKNRQIAALQSDADREIAALQVGDTMIVRAAYVLGGWQRVATTTQELLDSIREGQSRSPIQEVTVGPNIAGLSRQPEDDLLAEITALRKQRDEAEALLAEKDRQIAALRKILPEG